jgi:ankyrin repeat protein
VNLLLDRGADVDAQRRDGMTALHTAAYRGHLRVIRRLLERGANPTIRAREAAGPHAGQTPADTADAQGQTAAAELIRAAARGPLEG